MKKKLELQFTKYLTTRNFILQCCNPKRLILSITFDKINSTNTRKKKKKTIRILYNHENLLHPNPDIVNTTSDIPNKRDFKRIARAIKVATLKRQGRIRTTLNSKSSIINHNKSTTADSISINPSLSLQDR